MATKTQKKRLNAEDFYQISCIGELSADRSGTQIAWRETCWDTEKPLSRQDFVQRIHRKYLAGGIEEIITAGGTSESRPLFLADGSIIFLSDGPDAPALPEPGTMEQRRVNELFLAPQLYRWYGGHVTKLTHFLHGVEEYQVSPDERYALLTLWSYAGDTPDSLVRERTEQERQQLAAQYAALPVVIDKIPFVGDRELGYSSDRTQSLWLLDLQTGAVCCFLHADCGFDEPIWTPDGNAILYSDTNENGSLCFLRKEITDTDCRQGGKVWASVQGIQVGFDGLYPCFSADGAWILFAGNLPEDEYNMPKLLYAIPASGGEHLEPVCLIDPAKTVDGIMPDTFLWTMGDTGRDFVPAEDGCCYFTSAVQGSLHLFRVPINGTGMAEPEPVWAGEGAMTNLIPLERDGFLCIYSDPVTLPEITRLGPRNRLERLTGHNLWLSERAITKPTEIWAETADGKSRTQGWVLLPLSENERVPAILFIHGGPNGFAGTAMDLEYHLLAAEGYAVIWCNPRGSSGYGRDRGDMELAYGEPALSDFLAIVEEACSRFPVIDPERIGVTGGSYGGYGTIWCASHSDRFKAACAMRPLANMRMMSASSHHAGTEPSREKFPEFLDCMLDEIRQSPNAYAEHIRIPFQIMQSVHDENCVPEQMYQLYNSIRRFHPEVPCRMVLYPDSGHGLLRNGPVYLAVQARKDLLEWFKTYLTQPEKGEQYADAFRAI